MDEGPYAPSEVRQAREPTLRALAVITIKMKENVLDIFTPAFSKIDLVVHPTWADQGWIQLLGSTMLEVLLLFDCIGLRYFGLFESLTVSLLASQD